MPPRPEIPWRDDLGEISAQRVRVLVESAIQGLGGKASFEELKHHFASRVHEQYSVEPAKSQLRRFIKREVIAGRLQRWQRGLYRLPTASEPVPPTLRAIQRRPKYVTIQRHLAWQFGGAATQAQFLNALGAPYPKEKMEHGVRYPAGSGHGVYPQHWMRPIRRAIDEGFLLDDWTEDEPRRTKPRKKIPANHPEPALWDGARGSIRKILRLPDALLEDIPLTGFALFHMLKNRARPGSDWQGRKRKLYAAIGETLAAGRSRKGLGHDDILLDHEFCNLVEDEMTQKTRLEDQHALLAKAETTLGVLVDARLREEGLPVLSDVHILRPDPDKVAEAGRRGRVLRDTILTRVTVGGSAVRAQLYNIVLANIENGDELSHYYMPLSLLRYFAEKYGLDLFSLSRGVLIDAQAGRETHGALEEFLRARMAERTAADMVLRSQKRIPDEILPQVVT